MLRSPSENRTYLINQAITASAFFGPTDAMSRAELLGRSCYVAIVGLRLRGERGGQNMNIRGVKTTGFSLALAAAFLVAAGSSAFAQVPQRFDRDRDGR